MIYFMLDICENASGLRTIFLVKTVIGLIAMVVPIILMVTLMINCVSALVKGDDDLLAKIKTTAVNKIIACVIVFLVPTGVDLILKVIGAGSNYLRCYANANEQYISMREEEEQAQKELERQQRAQAIKNKADQIEEEKRQAALNNAINNANGGNGGGGTPGQSGGYTGDSDNSNYSDKVTTTNIVYIKTDDLAVPLYYSDHTTIFSQLAVNSEISTQMHNILNNVSKYVKENSDMIPRFETAGAYVGKSGYHGRGLAIDLFNLWEFEYNGKTYYPYANYGPSSWTNYNKFVCEVCAGKENCKYNINYIIYEKYFKGNGWCWGGNWGTQYHDPMHYELSDNGCSTKNKPIFSC